MARKKKAALISKDQNILLPSRPRKVNGPQYHFRQAALSPDGSQIAFHFAGDVWLVEASGGNARRLTSHWEDNYAPVFSPDGKTLAFASDRTGGGNIYLLSLENQQAPRRLTFHTASVPPASWSPDGKWLYFTSYYDGIGEAIYKINIQNGMLIKVHGNPQEDHHHPAVSPDGKWIAFNNNGQVWWRNGQNPSELSDIWLIPNETDTSDTRKLNQYQGKNLNPMWGTGGEALFFLSDRDSTENIWKMSLSGDKKATRITRFRSGRVIRPAISADGKWVVFERDFKLWLLNLETKKAAPVDIQVWVDEKNNSTYQYAAPDKINEFALSPDGKKVGFVVRGDIFADMAEKGKKKMHSFQATRSFNRKKGLWWAPNSQNLIYVSDQSGEDQLFDYDFGKREPVQLTKHPGQKHLPKISPDGKWLSYVYGDSEIRLMDGRSKAEKAFIKNQVFMNLPYNVSYCWSPDSQWIAFAGWDHNFFCNIYVQHLSEETPRQLTFLSNIKAYNLHWAPNGKYIVFNTEHHRGEYQIARVDLQPIFPTFKEDDFDKLFQEAKKEQDKKVDKSKKKNGTIRYR